jgi:6-phosphogluconolactonase/glucosamine-6-phosphate isomerase/deaminase
MRPVPLPSSKQCQKTDALIETAKKLGISTEGKNKAQILDEIVAKSKASATMAELYLLKNAVERELAIGLSLSQGIQSNPLEEG